MKNQLPQSLEPFQGLTRELTAKVMQGRRLSNLISTLASFPGSLSLITDFKFPVSEWEEGCQGVFLEYFGENTESPGKAVLGHICVSPTSALPAPLTAVLSPVHCDGWGHPWQPDQSHPPLSLQSHTHPGRGCEEEENSVPQQPLETSPALPAPDQRGRMMTTRHLFPPSFRSLLSWILQSGN